MKQAISINVNGVDHAAGAAGSNLAILNSSH